MFSAMGGDTLTVWGDQLRGYNIDISNPENQKERELIHMFNDACSQYETMLRQISREVLPAHLFKLLIWCIPAAYLWTKRECAGAALRRLVAVTMYAQKK